MSQADYRFDGRVAIVTGAGRGVGRAYACLLADQGAQVVVNDIGTSLTGDGNDEEPANEVVQDIRKAGGEASADTNDVSTGEGSQALIRGTLDRYGRLDILVSNAGIIDRVGFPEVDLDNIRRHVYVHVFGSFNMLKAAWPPFAKQGYGRVVLTTSTGIFGSTVNTGYATAKAAVIGLARSASLAGAPYGIKVNVVSPAALTRMARKDGTEPAAEGEDSPIPASAVAPMVGLLAHDSCPVTGEILVAGGGRFARLFIGVTRGYLHHSLAPPTIEDVAANFGAVCDEQAYYVPPDLGTWTSEFLKHVDGFGTN